jgi:hypothetical protein
MQILFIDESGTPPPTTKIETSPYFVLGGIIIPDEFWHRVKSDLDAAKREFGVTGEIKWRYFSPDKRKPNALSHLDAEGKEARRSRLYAVVSRYKSIRTMSVVVDVHAAYALDYIRSPDALYWYAYKVMTERFQYHLQDISRISGQRINGIIICDHRAPEDDRRLQELHGKLLAGGHNMQSSYANLVEGLFIAPSHLSVGIQFADMIAGAVLRHVKAKDDRFIKQIETTFRRSPEGRVSGFGLIQFPKKKG